MTDQEILVGLDIGTTKIVALVCMKSAKGKYSIIGFGRDSAKDAILAGEVLNIEKTVDAIKRAINAASLDSNVNIKIVQVGIAGKHIKSLQARGQRIKEDSDQLIDQNDLDLLLKDMYNISLDPEDEIIHIIPQNYNVDEHFDIMDPMGMPGSRIEGNYHIITGNVTAIRNIGRCVQRAGLKIEGMTLEPVASAEAVLSTEEKEAGVALLDIGGGTSDLVIFHEGMICHSAVIPLGGEIITKDVKKGLEIRADQAEKLKIKFGSAFPDKVSSTEFVLVPGHKGIQDKEISLKNLSLIIHARIEEIFEHVLFEIESSGYRTKLQAGIVLTGGGAGLKQLREYVIQLTNIPARIGLPNDDFQHNHEDLFHDPANATVIGLIISGAKNQNLLNKESGQEDSPISSKFKRFFDRINGWLINDQEIRDFE